jgi:hypothetical protein
MLMPNGSASVYYVTITRFPCSANVYYYVTISAYIALTLYYYVAIIGFLCSANVYYYMTIISPNVYYYDTIIVYFLWPCMTKHAVCMHLNKNE